MSFNDKEIYLKNCSYILSFNLNFVLFECLWLRIGNFSLISGKGGGGVVFALVGSS